MEKETLEEAAANLVDPNLCKTDNWIAGANWQAKRMYSEEEVDELVNNLIDKFLNYNGSYVDNEKLKLFYQQFKNK